MIARDLYNDILRLTDMTEGRFVGLYNMTVNELCTTYGEKFVLVPFKVCDGDKTNIELHEKIKTVNDEAVHFPEYNGAIINNILFLDDTNKTIHKEKSISLSKSAYHSVWKNAKKVKRAKARPWF